MLTKSRGAYSSVEAYNYDESPDKKQNNKGAFTGLTSDNIRPSSGLVKKMRPTNRGGANV